MDPPGCVGGGGLSVEVTVLGRCAGSQSLTGGEVDTACWTYRADTAAAPAAPPDSTRWRRRRRTRGRRGPTGIQGEGTRENSGKEGQGQIKRRKVEEVVWKEEMRIRGTKGETMCKQKY